MERQRTYRRFTRSNRCPICGGHDGLGRGHGVRCFGYYDGSGKYARCTREERAGSLPPNRDGTFSHRLHGTWCCGQVHAEVRVPAGDDRPATRSLPNRRAQQRFWSYFTLRAFLRRRYGEGTRLRHWIYRNAADREVFRVLRIDYRSPDGADAKSYRPCHQGADGRWLLSRPDGLLPLYPLPVILSAPPGAIITVLEGEKCADLATSIGLPHATTSAHGASAPQLTDWSPLAGRLVAILCDEDRDGAGYAAQIAIILATLNPPARVRIVRLPGLSDSDDIEQWIAARRSSGRRDAEILADLSTLIDNSLI